MWGQVVAILGHLGVREANILIFQCFLMTLRSILGCPGAMFGPWGHLGAILGTIFHFNFLPFRAASSEDRCHRLKRALFRCTFFGLNLLVVCAGPSCRYLGPSWGSRSKNINFPMFFNDVKVNLLWVVRGPCLGHLSPSWGHFGPFWGRVFVLIFYPFRAATCENRCRVF